MTNTKTNKNVQKDENNVSNLIDMKIGEARMCQKLILKLSFPSRTILNNLSIIEICRKLLVDTLLFN